MWSYSFVYEISTRFSSDKSDPSRYNRFRSCLTSTSAPLTVSESIDFDVQSRNVPPAGSASLNRTLIDPVYVGDPLLRLNESTYPTSDTRPARSCASTSLSTLSVSVVDPFAMACPLFP